MQRRAAASEEDDDGGPRAASVASVGRVRRRVESIQGAGPIGRSLQTTSSNTTMGDP